MATPIVIAINSVGGGGKSTLATALHDSISGSALFCFDDFDATNVYPRDYVEWLGRGADISEFDFPEMALAVEAAVKSGGAEYVFLDYPFGREHPRLRELIDVAVYIDTPLDMALARRLLRDYNWSSAAFAARTLAELREDIEYYFKQARPLFLHHQRHQLTSDLVLDGCLRVEDLKERVMALLRQRRGSADQGT
jgi:uridine kinase